MPDWSDKIKKVTEAAATNRCQALAKGDQCWFEVVEGSKYCPIHGGNKFLEKKEKESLYSFRSVQYQARLQKLNGHEELRSLHNEIGVLRIIIEETMNQCVKAEDIMRHGGFLSDTIVKVEKLVSSCHKIEKSLGQLLDQNSALQFSQQVARIYTEQQALVIQKFWLLPEAARTQETMTKMFNEELIDCIIGEIARALIKLRPSEQAFDE